MFSNGSKRIVADNETTEMAGKKRIQREAYYLFQWRAGRLILGVVLGGIFASPQQFNYVTSNPYTQVDDTGNR
jgi:hypothetical protein